MGHGSLEAVQLMENPQLFHDPDLNQGRLFFHDLAHNTSWLRLCLSHCGLLNPLLMVCLFQALTTNTSLLVLKAWERIQLDGVHVLHRLPRLQALRELVINLDWTDQTVISHGFIAIRASYSCHGTPMLAQGTSDILTT